VGFDVNDVSLFCLPTVLMHDPLISGYPPLIDTDKAIINKGRDSRYLEPVSLGYPELGNNPLDPHSRRWVYNGVAERKSSHIQEVNSKAQKTHGQTTQLGGHR
jgi:hypothetical protein